ncbi:hypothetical protein C7212DRAFT_188143 [Tuber magnatum]|uniref:C2H2-type domain-containing protein n=1 Tax=Tuber magnatum TaxID=42249 RepID=A0A317SR98_9PEZI|nr:hypothetical protein C7212DRAFT_188143 [Tuber magnatum]
MSCQEYQKIQVIIQNPKFVQDLFLRFQNGLDSCCKMHYGNQFTRVINNDDFLLLLLQAIVAAHSDAPEESNAVCPRHTGEPHSEGGYFQESWHHPYNPLNPELARLDTLFLHDMDRPSPTSRAEIVQQVIANVDQQLPEDTAMSEPHSENQPQQQAQPPPSPQIYQTNTASGGNLQTQQMRQQPFSLAQAGIFNPQNPRRSAGNHTSDSGESSGTQSDNSFASRRPGGKRVPGRYRCPVEDCPKRNEDMQKCRLDDHMALHEPDRRTPCPSCPKIYMHSRTCNEHHKKVHGMDLKRWCELQAHQFAQQAASLGDLEGNFAEEEAVTVAPVTVAAVN